MTLLSQLLHTNFVQLETAAYSVFPVAFSGHVYVLSETFPKATVLGYPDSTRLSLVRVLRPPTSCSVSHIGARASAVPRYTWNRLNSTTTCFAICRRCLSLVVVLSTGNSEHQVDMPGILPLVVVSLARAGLICVCGAMSMTVCHRWSGSVKPYLNWTLLLHTDCQDPGTCSLIIPPTYGQPTTVYFDVWQLALDLNEWRT